MDKENQIIITAINEVLEQLPKEDLFRIFTYAATMRDINRGIIKWVI